MTTSSPVRIPVDGGELPADLHLPAGGRGPGIVLFQEIFGVTSYISSRADDLAGLGYVVLVPHVYWRQGDPLIEGGDDAMPRAFEAMNKVVWPEAVADGVAAVAALRERPELDGPAGVFGFCFGGGLAFAVTAADDPDFLVSYYGSALPNLLDQAPQVTVPSLHHFGLADDYLTPDVVDRITQAVAGPEVTVLTYAGAGHAFDSTNPMFRDDSASRDAWTATEEWLARRVS